MHSSRRQLLKSALACGLLASARPAWAAPGHVLRVGPSQRYTSIAAAARDARDGDTIEIEAGEYRADVAVWPAAQLLIRAVDGRASLIADGAAAEGKAIWVLRGGTVRIENIDFSGTRVPAGPGSVTRRTWSRIAMGRNISSQAEIGRSTPSPRASRSPVKTSGSLAVRRWVWNR